MKAIPMGYKAISLCIACLLFAQSSLAADCQNVICSNCYPDPWHEFERRDKNCQHVYMPGHWVGNTYQEYYIEPSIMNAAASADDPDVAYDPNDDRCVNRF